MCMYSIYVYSHPHGNGCCLSTLWYQNYLQCCRTVLIGVGGWWLGFGIWGWGNPNPSSSPPFRVGFTLHPTPHPVPSSTSRRGGAGAMRCRSCLRVEG